MYTVIQCYCVVASISGKLGKCVVLQNPVISSEKVNFTPRRHLSYMYYTYLRVDQVSISVNKSIKVTFSDEKNKNTKSVSFHSRLIY